MAEMISIKADIDECISLLNTLDKNERKIRRRMLSQTGTAVKNKVKKSYSSMLSKRTGALYKILKLRVVKAGNMAVVYPAAERGKVRYGFVLAKGAEIAAKDGNLLPYLNITSADGNVGGEGIIDYSFSGEALSVGNTEPIAVTVHHRDESMETQNNQNSNP